MDKYISKLSKEKLEKSLENEDELFKHMFNIDRKGSIGKVNSLLYGLLIFSVSVFIALLSISIYIISMSSITYLIESESKMIVDLITFGLLSISIKFLISKLKKQSIKKFSSNVSPEELDKARKEFSTKYNTYIN